MTTEPERSYDEDRRYKRSSPHQQEKATCAVCSDPGEAITGQVKVPSATPETDSSHQAEGWNWLI